MNLKEENIQNAPLAELDLSAHFREQSALAEQLLSNIKQQLPKLEELMAHCESESGIEEGFYRFYHQSFKVYPLQQTTLEICSALQDLLPGRPMNKWFYKIIADGTATEFDLSHNQDWLQHTRPILEAFFHAHLFLKMAIQYGHELETAPDRLPCGWAAVLYLFNLR